MEFPKKIVDIHSHILPGVDDGSKSMEETIQMLRLACAEGITDMIVTPHYQSGRYYTPYQVIREKIAAVKKAIQGESDIKIRLYPGTEIYYRSGLEERLDHGELATLNGGSHVLVEFSPMEEFSYIRNAMEELMGIGYSPILAHVERFRCMREDAGRVVELRKMGCEIQVNAGSIAGNYGFTTKRYLHKLLKEELVNYIGTDAHCAPKGTHGGTGRAPYMKKCAELLYRKYDAEYVDCILYKNAERNLLQKNEKIQNG